MSDGATIVKINNPKLKALLEDAEKKGLCIKPFMENSKYDFSVECYDYSIVDGCPKDLDDLKDYILQLIEVVNDFDHYQDYWFKKLFEDEYPNLKDSFTYVSWAYVPADYDKSDYDNEDILEFKYGKPGRKKESNKKQNGPSTLKEIFPRIDMTKPSGLVIDAGGCCTGYDRKQHAEFLGEENCLFITKDVKTIEDEDEEIFDLLTMYDKCVVTSDLEDFGEYYNCGGFRLFYIIDVVTNKVVYSSEKDEFCSDTYGLSLSLSLEEEEDDHFNEVLGKYTKCDDSNSSGETEEEFDEEDLGKAPEGKITAKKSSKSSTKTTVSKPKADCDETEEITITYDKYKVKATVQVKGDDRILAGTSLSAYTFFEKNANRSWKIVEEKLIPDVIRNFHNGEIRFETADPYFYSTKSRWSKLSKREISLVTQESAAHIRELRSKPGYLKNGMFANKKLLAEVEKHIAEDGFSFEDTLGAILDYWNSFTSMDPSLFTSVLETFPRKKDGSLFSDRKAILPISSNYWFVDIETGNTFTFDEISFHIWGDGGIHM